MARCSTAEEQKKELIFTDRTFPLFSKRDCNHASRQARYRAFLPIPQTPIALPAPEAHRAEKAKVWRDIAPSFSSPNSDCLWQVAKPYRALIVKT